MLSEKEKEELISLALSAAIREEFRQLRKMPCSGDQRPITVDELMSFLTAMGRMSALPAEPRAFVPYKFVRI